MLDNIFYLDRKVIARLEKYCYSKNGGFQQCAAQVLASRLVEVKDSPVANTRAVRIRRLIQLRSLIDKQLKTDDS